MWVVLRKLSSSVIFVLLLLVVAIAWTIMGDHNVIRLDVKPSKESSHIQFIAINSVVVVVRDEVGEGGGT